MAFQEERKFFFVSQAYPEDTFAVVRFKGTEGISRLYEFEILLVAEDPDIDIKKVLNNPARFTIARGDKEVVFNGILAYFDQLHEVDEYVFYRTLLVPRLWVSTIHHENELFLDQSVPEIIEEILKQAGLTSRDYEFKLTGNYPKWEYICQYRETDYNFISRWMEREGIYFFFDQTDEGEKLIITDTSSAHQDLPEDPTVYYSPPSALVPTEEEVIKAFVCRQRRLPKKVILKDYNYRKPSLEIKGEATVDPEGKGEVYLYGEHFKTPEEGNHLAKIRAEEMLCREKVFYGESTAPHLRPGYYFQLEDHYRDSFNQKYLVVEIEHEGSQAGLLLAGLSEELTEEEQDLVYHNRFVAIPADVQFRPERKTPKPRFYGTMNAKIDASGDGKYAEIDEWGRYKVILPFDMKNKGGGKASRWIRMAQPYAGAGFGMHFPLHKGTEVILTFIDGDPDRPIIAGAVPNPETMSPVTSENPTKAGFVTGGGNIFMMEDSEGHQRVSMASGDGKGLIQIGSGSKNNLSMAIPTAGISLVENYATAIMDSQRTSISVGGLFGNLIEGSLKSVIGGMKESTENKIMQKTVESVYNIVNKIYKFMTTKTEAHMSVILSELIEFVKPMVSLTVLNEQASLTMDAGGAPNIVINTASNCCIEANENLFVFGEDKAYLASSKKAAIGGGKDVLIFVPERLSPTAKINLEKDGDIEVEAKKDIEIKANEKTELITADNKIIINKDGKIVIKSDKNIELVTENNKIIINKDGNIIIESNKKIELKKGKTSLTIEDKEIKIDGENTIVSAGNKISLLGDNAIVLDGSDVIVKGKIYLG